MLRRIKGLFRSTGLEDLAAALTSSTLKLSPEQLDVLAVFRRELAALKSNLQESRRDHGDVHVQKESADGND